MKPKHIMKLKFITTLALSLIAGPAARAESPQPLAVAVFDFESKDENVHDLGAKVATLINANLSAEPNLILVERAELEKVLGEQELGLSGTVSPASAAKVGQLTGAKVLVTGRVFKTDTEIFLVAKIIGTETSRVYGEMVKGGVDAAISDLSETLAKKIAADVAQKGDTLVAKVESPEERVAMAIGRALGRRHWIDGGDDRVSRSSARSRYVRIGFTDGQRAPGALAHRQSASTDGGQRFVRRLLRRSHGLELRRGRRQRSQSSVW